jgi:hypothetical protein
MSDEACSNSSQQQIRVPFFRPKKAAANASIRRRNDEDEEKIVEHLNQVKFHFSLIPVLPIPSKIVLSRNWMAQMMLIQIHLLMRAVTKYPIHESQRRRSCPNWSKRGGDYAAEI